MCGEIDSIGLRPKLQPYDIIVTRDQLLNICSNIQPSNPFTNHLVRCQHGIGKICNGAQSQIGHPCANARRIVGKHRVSEILPEPICTTDFKK